MSLHQWETILTCLHSETTTSTTTTTTHYQPGDGYRRLPPDIKGLLLEVLASGILARENDPQAPISMAKLTQPVEARLHGVLTMLRGGVRGGIVVREAEVVCSLYMGLARAIDMTNARLLSGFMTSSLPHLVELAKLCHSYPEVLYSILLCLRDYAEVQISSLQVRAVNSSDQ